MASGGTPNGRENRPAVKLSSFSEPRPKKRPVPRFDTSFDTELSLNTELRRSEDTAHVNQRSLPNNLWLTLGASGNMAERPAPTGGHKQARPFEHVILQEHGGRADSSPQADFRRKKHHTPATIPRTKLPPGTPKAERDALERLRVQLTFVDDEVPTRGPSNSTSSHDGTSSAANNERLVGRSVITQSLPTQESNDTDVLMVNGAVAAAGSDAANDKGATLQILERLKQVRDFLKQATSMFVTMSFGGNEEQRSSEYEQAAKLHRLITHLKSQEKAYTELLQRTMAVEDDATTENTPSASVQSTSDNEHDETPSIREEELQGLRQQHALLQKMLEQQKQLKDLQTRQAALLTLQKDAEQRLAQAEGEDEGAVGGTGYDTTSGRSRSNTEASEATTNELSADEWGLTPEQLALQNFIRRNKEKKSASQRNERDKDEGNQRKPNKNQRSSSNVDIGLSSDVQSVSDGQPDNEEAALAIADAAQERLELENKLMALQAKKEQMDSLLSELQHLREAQIRKESIEARKPHVASINVAKKDNAEEKPLATASQKVDDDSILEALEVHNRLQRLQDVKKHLQHLRDMIGQYQVAENSEVNSALAAAEDSAPESGRADDDDDDDDDNDDDDEDDDGDDDNDDDDDAEEEEQGAVGGVDPILEHSNVDWILNYGIEDPELITKLRQLQAARERVMNLKQTNQTTQLPVGTSRFHNETNNQTQSQTEEETETDATNTDTESNASSSVNAMAWQDDPEFQDKIKKLKSAKRKLKQLQELVKRVHQFPDATPVLPTELADLSFEDIEDEEEETSNSDYDEEADNDGRDENQDTETASIQDEQSAGLPDGTASEQEAEYQIRLQKQKNELARLLEERQRLMEMQETLSRLTQQQQQQPSQAAQSIPIITKTEPVDASTTAEARGDIRRSGASPSLLRTNTFTVHKPAVPVPPKQLSDNSTQTAFERGSVIKTKARKVNSVDSSEAARAPTSSALIWSELRRQRELHEEKLKKRKHRLLNEKRKKAGLDDVSEGGTYSLRSADVDEGFGVSMMSADITTATWGGSTQPSSTQNDSAVSEDDSEAGNQEQEIAVEVEDDYPDGIVQAEEEEEEQDDPRDVTDVFRSRERAPRFPNGNSRSAKKRNRTSKGLTFAWPRIGSDRPSRRSRQRNFVPAEELIEEREREQFILERQAWEQQCDQLHGEVAKLTDMCNNLLRDQQTLISALIGRNNLPVSAMAPGMSPPTAHSNPFSQYQQKQQDAYHSLHNYFDHQRYLLQHQQLMQTLNQCYAQLYQQQLDLGFLQGQFQQLFSGNASPGSQSQYPPPPPPPTTSRVPSSNPFSTAARTSGTPTFPSLHTYSNQAASSMFPNPGDSPYNPFNMPSFQANETPGFTPATLNQSDLQWPRSALSQSGNLRAPSWMPVFTERPPEYPSQSTQTDHIANPDTGVPSPRYSGLGSVTAPSSVPRTTASNASSSTVPNNYNPAAYAEASGAVISSTKQSNKSSDAVGRTFPTPLRAQAVANLANKDRSSLKRAHESVESLSSVPGDDTNKGTNQDIDRASDAGSEFSLFEALRDSIYSEVATLISLNESRPHFLIELFRELQLLTSDYLRQRALYALRDIVTRFLTEDSVTAGMVDKALQHPRFQAWAGSNSELTPSETVETSEDESRDDAVEAQVVTEGVYDYAENVESGSTLSTPTSSHTGDPPFASDGLGETVIHFDQTLSKMREYERLREEGKLSELQKFAFGLPYVSKGTMSNRVVKDDVTTSSAGDVGSDSSFSDVQYPRIDTQALDHQIKSIMSEVIPYLNEHMEDSCTPDLLGYIRGLVLSRIRIREEQEFGRFFHKQLASILQDSLSKFEERKMKDCGEDMLVDMSEILFNELAFFKLMQDLDGPGTRHKQPFWRQESQSGTDTGTGQEGDKEDEDQDEQPEDSATEETESTMKEKPEDDKNNEQEEDNSDSSDDESSSEDSDAEDEAAGGDDEAAEEDEEPTPITKEQKEAEEEALGKDRDDDMAAQFQDMPEGSTDSKSECVKLELSVSETKPFTSAGSGEEDGEESYDDLQSKRTLEDCEGGTAAGRDNSDDSDDDDNDRPTQEAAAERPEHLQNGQVQDEQDEVAIDDLPTKLTGLTEADLQARIAEEQSKSEGVQAVLDHLNSSQELVGEAEVLREPESTIVNGTPEDEK